MGYSTWFPTIAITGLATYYLYTRQIPQRLLHWVLSSAKTSSKLKLTSKKPHYQVIFFPDSEILCKDFVFSNGKHCTRGKSCTFTHEKTSFFQLTQHLMKAQKTLDVCVYTICHELLGDIIIELHKQRGVLVRVITDDEALMGTNCQVGRLKSEGIGVRVDLTNTLMHHKFVVVDNKLLINGSFNWSFNAVTRNNENVLITDNEELVSPYIGQFQKLWELFNPDKEHA